uniref:Integral to membrane n=1 Tax=Rhipicephalus appendiculatus TaxID=34631 RepID=A0A131YZN5_RHIAP
MALLRAVIVHCCVLAGCVLAQFNWHVRDNFDDIRTRIDKVRGDNCRVVDVNELFLPNETVTHVPNIQRLNIDPVFPNRTNLLHIHNMAISRAFFFSFILQKAADNDEPGFMYYFMSVISDVAANRFINSSAIYYAPNMSFTPSYKGFFNKTMPLFAPRAYRADDFNDPYHLEGTSTLNTIDAVDLGAIPADTPSRNYSSDQYRINEWYHHWLPDPTKRQDSKTTYTIQITHFNGTNETFVWHGPPDPSDNPGPVKWSRPYFDCERSNKWVYGATSPIPDIFPRHTQWRHIEIPKYVAVAVLELDFERLDINQCPIGSGNPRPNYFAGTSRCKNDTTECEPVHGYGFRRGGYQCRCRPGFRRPRIVRNPYHGELIERATEHDYRTGFHCEKIGYLMVQTQNLLRIAEEDRIRFIGMQANYMAILNVSSGANKDPHLVFTLMKAVTASNCAEIGRERPELLRLPGDVAHGRDWHLENEARSAVRLANFLSGFLQTVDPKELFAEFRVPDRSLTQDQIIGEAMSLVAGNQRILGCGVYFDRKQFPGRHLYAPYAYRRHRNERRFYIDDMARFRGAAYLQEGFFAQLKTRWAANLDDLVTYTTKIRIRYNSTGHNPINYDHYPLQYSAAEVEHGYWTDPYFDCGGLHTDWVMVYASPFFGWDSLHDRIEFKGVVAVTMMLSELDINQCPDYDPYTEENIFQDTHKCDRHSSRCVPILGRGFDSGGYKCECLQGFEYPYNDPITYFDGQIVEAEFEKVIEDNPSKYDTLKCRIAGASAVLSSAVLITVAVALLRALL